ncbi:TIGR00282 family metallophosphoesterase [Mesomycoplasma neurolyticum]|uniref:Putative metallophosphoesterase n=1 Tax=Mesomycoplasma neurolyticum TaxID=2120 RepID=A0A449A665_9BACT|nr:TIGR00282 family metallophosphoesterase [Mesomycoplasma neurolyticum]VEU59724.1 putative metallophosphoesterase [Mesomycoplasma neurolyticum]
MFYKNKNKELAILFIGDVFGHVGIHAIEKYLNKIKAEYKIDVVIAQCENVTNRKGMNQKDYKILKKLGVDIITLGNHVWADKDILNIIENKDILRPYNVNDIYPGHGTEVFEINGVNLRVTSMLGQIFNKLLKPWNEEIANNFFDAFDEIEKNDLKNQNVDYHIIDFHAETTSEKNVFGLYLDGKISAMLGTHTHVQTNDAKVLPKGTLYITDVGMTGPSNAAIGANYEEIYQKMRFGKYTKFKISNTTEQFNAVYLFLSKNEKDKKIFPISI